MHLLVTWKIRLFMENYGGDKDHHSFIHSIGYWFDWLTSYLSICSTEHFLNFQYRSGTQVRHLRKSRRKRFNSYLQGAQSLVGGDKMLKKKCNNSLTLHLCNFRAKEQAAGLGKTSRALFRCSFSDFCQVATKLQRKEHSLQTESSLHMWAGIKN